MTKLVKVNEYKYQVIKPDQKNNVTLSYTPDMVVDIFETEVEITKSYADIETTEAQIVQKLEIKLNNFNDHIVALEMYVKDDMVTYVHQQMQATIEEVTKIDETKNNQHFEQKEIQKDNQGYIKIKNNEQVILKNLDFLEQSTSNKQDLEEIKNYRNYLKSGKLSRKFFKTINKSQQMLSKNLQIKLDAIITFEDQTVEILTNSGYAVAEKEMIIDYIIVSKYLIELIYNEFKYDKKLYDNQQLILEEFRKNANCFLDLLQKNSEFTNKFILFIGAKLPVLQEISQSGVYNEQIFVDITNEAIVNQKALEEEITNRANIKYQTIKS